MSQEIEEQISQHYRDRIETTIKGWFLTDLNKLDRQMTDCYGDPAREPEFIILMGRKKGLLNRIQLLTQKVIILCAEVKEKLEAEGFVILLDEFFDNQIEHMLTRLGVTHGYLEGACLDVTGISTL